MDILLFYLFNFGENILFICYGLVFFVISMNKMWNYALLSNTKHSRPTELSKIPLRENSRKCKKNDLVFTHA